MDRPTKHQTVCYVCERRPVDLENPRAVRRGMCFECLDTSDQIEKDEANAKDDDE